MWRGVVCVGEISRRRTKTTQTMANVNQQLNTQMRVTLASASREISTETASTSAVGHASPTPMYPLAGRE